MITINPDKLVRNVSKSGEFIFRGGLSLQAELGRQNVQRYQKFLTTPKGKLFVAKQVLLQALNPKKDTRIYNPLATVVSKALPQELTAFKPKRHVETNSRGIISLFRNFINNGSTKSSQENAVKFFDNRLKKQVNLQVRYGGELNNLASFPNRQTSRGNREVKDFIKFRIRDAVNGKYIIFPAILQGGINDSSNAETTSYNYIGRADKVYVYGGYTRNISFSVNIVSQRKSDIGIIWEKINYAKGLVLPQYKEFFSQDSVNDTTRPVSPIVYLTLGDLFNDAPGFFNSVNLEIPENSTWELSDGTQVPHICTLSFDFTYIGKQNPTMTSAHYNNIGKKFPSGDPNETPEDILKNELTTEQELEVAIQGLRNLGNF